MRAALAQALFIEPDILLLVCHFLDSKSWSSTYALLFPHRRAGFHLLWSGLSC